MLSDTSVNISSGSISAGIEAEDSLKAVISFIKLHYKTFAENNQGQISMNEKGLSQNLCILLNRNAKKYPFFFHPEFMENINSGVSPQVDIGTMSYDDKIIISDREYSEHDSFFSIEAKRLPTPGSTREKEYVIGNPAPSGAMERFKKGIHGSALKFAAIIGYVQKENYDHWFLKINSWIDELTELDNFNIWQSADKIKRTDNQGPKEFAEFESINSRIVNGKRAPDIKIFHFWINLTTTGLGNPSI